MNRPDLTGLKAEQLAYIQYLENCTSGASNLIKELNLVSNTFANDLERIREGTDVDVKTKTTGDKTEVVTVYNNIFIKDNKDDKTFERVMVLFDKIDKIKALASLTAPKEVSQDKPKKKMEDYVVNK